MFKSICHHHSNEMLRVSSSSTMNCSRCRRVRGNSNSSYSNEVTHDHLTQHHSMMHNLPSMSTLSPSNVNVTIACAAYCRLLTPELQVSGVCTQNSASRCVAAWQFNGSHTGAGIPDQRGLTIVKFSITRNVSWSPRSCMHASPLEKATVSVCYHLQTCDTSGLLPSTTCSVEITPVRLYGSV